MSCLSFTFRFVSSSTHIIAALSQNTSVTLLMPLVLPCVLWIMATIHPQTILVLQYSEVVDSIITYTSSVILSSYIVTLRASLSVWLGEISLTLHDLSASVEVKRESLAIQISSI
ncbi:uncharacterized protein EDB91DRAFT_233258 [Suillus paluster]|uniref:uncharacterized protein n=1 Tax=Suillus paluster TaxID=48578 RepID=UPI001B86E9BE|nr:uncharacterized protein EDB91DRAFT_233258 [Suillus paluster]KAG1743192.1 hypothetical protein EDB91DRAFT_233258 [Suillus paluster]